MRVLAEDQKGPQGNQISISLCTFFTFYLAQSTSAHIPSSPCFGGTVFLIGSIPGQTPAKLRTRRKGTSLGICLLFGHKCYRKAFPFLHSCQEARS